MPQQKAPVYDLEYRRTLKALGELTFYRDEMDHLREEARAAATFELEEEDGLWTQNGGEWFSTAEDAVDDYVEYLAREAYITKRYDKLRVAFRSLDEMNTHNIRYAGCRCVDKWEYTERDFEIVVAQLDAVLELVGEITPKLKALDLQIEALDQYARPRC